MYGKRRFKKRLATLPSKLVLLQQDVHTELGIDASQMNDELLCHVLATEIELQGIEFVHGKGNHKTALQRLYERAEALVDKRKEYEAQLAIMGERNSYSKTDPDATFMRMKEDHMQNGQLKPGYNVQIAVHSEYIMGVGIFPNPNDTNTLILFLHHLESLHASKFRYIVADAGYDSYENLLWLEEKGYLSCIKPKDYERSKQRKWKTDIGKARNMEYRSNEDAFICAKGRKLHYSHCRKSKSKTGFTWESNVYICESCNRCGYKSECQRYAKKRTKNPTKQICITPGYDSVLQHNQERILSTEGIRLRTNRSIQVEGAFGVLKQDFQFRRLLHRGNDHVRRMLYLLAMGFNISKLHYRIQDNRIHTSLFCQKEIA